MLIQTTLFKFEDNYSNFLGMSEFYGFLHQVWFRHCNYKLFGYLLTEELSIFRKRVSSFRKLFSSDEMKRTGNYIHFEFSQNFGNFSIFYRSGSPFVCCDTSWYHSAPTDVLGRCCIIQVHGHSSNICCSVSAASLTQETAESQVWLNQEMMNFCY